MNANEIQVKVDHDVQMLLEHKDAISKLMVVPSTETFECIDNKDRQFWIIGRKDEYCITLNETSGKYGLAFRNILNNLVYLGDDGSIADAYAVLISREEDEDESRNKAAKKPGSVPFRQHGNHKQDRKSRR